jgi:hypothetical protein
MADGTTLPRHLSIADAGKIAGELEQIAKAAGDLMRRSAELLEDGPRARLLPVSVQRESANRKLAPQNRVEANNGRIRNEPSGPFVVSTHVSIQATCPDTCRFKSNGCYAEAGLAHLALRRLDDGAKGWVPREVSLLEARMIDALWSQGIPQDGARGGRDLRMHVAGDVADGTAARALGDAASRFRGRGGGRVWTYTHRWRQIARSVWGPGVSVLASIEDPSELAAAAAQGYASAIVVQAFESRLAFPLGDGWRAIPCPAEAGRMTCAQCRLCLDGDRLLSRKLVIAFALHGSDAAKVRLPVLRR